MLKLPELRGNEYCPFPQVLGNLKLVLRYQHLPQQLTQDRVIITCRFRWYAHYVVVFHCKVFLGQVRESSSSGVKIPMETLRDSTKLLPVVFQAKARDLETSNTFRMWGLSPKRKTLLDDIRTNLGR